jgi:hypothetical protein
MLVPAFIFLMILSPALLPAGITAVDAIKRAYRRTYGCGPDWFMGRGLRSMRMTSADAFNDLQCSGSPVNVWSRLSAARH